MGFHDVSLSDQISYGSRGGPRFNSEIITSDSGFEEILSRWENVRHVFSIGYGIEQHEDLVLLKEFYIARQGAANSFRFKDWIDHNTSNGLDPNMGGIPVAFDDQLIEVADGVKTEFQFVKSYILSGSSSGIRRAPTATACANWARRAASPPT